MKKFLFFSLLALCLGVSLPAHTQNTNVLNIIGLVTSNDGQGIQDVEVSFVIVSGQDTGLVFTNTTDQIGNFQFNIELTNLTSQGCGDLFIVDCNGVQIIQTFCWHPNDLNISANFLFCDIIVDPSCSVDIIDAGNGTYPSILFADPEGQAPFSYYWSDGSPTSFILVLNPGTYCVAMNDANGCGTENCIILTGIDSCFVSIQNSNAGLSAYANGVEPFQYLWNTGETSQTISHINDGEYCVTVYDNAGCVATDCLDTLEPLCAVSLLCDPVENGVELWAIGEGAGIFDYHWSTGDSSLWILVQESGEYCVTLTDALGCMADTCMYLDLNWNADSCFVFISILDDSTTDFYTLSAVSNAGQNGHYEWSTGEIGLSINVLSPGTYCVTATTSNGCQVSNCIIIENNGGQCSVVIEHAQGSVNNYGVLYAFTEINEHYEFIWSDGTTGPEFLIPGPGEYCVIAYNLLTACTATACYFVDGNELCGVDLTCDPINGGVALFANAWGVEPISYEWSNGDDGPVIEVFENGWYCVTIIDATGCFSEACQEVVINNQNCWVEIERVYTNASDYGILIAHTSDDSAYVFEWFDGTQGPIFHIPGPGEYCVTALNNNMNCASTACFVVESNNQCSVEIICDPIDGGVLLFAEAWGTGTLVYTWNTGELTQNIEVFHDGYYCVTVRDELGCTAEACSEVFINNLNCWVEIELIGTNPSDGLDTLHAIIEPGRAADFIWENGDAGEYIGVSVPGTYCVTAIFSNNCVATACISYNPYCFDLAAVDFGECDLPLGVGWNGQECVYISGCSTIGPDGVDYESYFFPSFDICFDHCAPNTECLNLTNIDFGPCDAILGVGWNGQECVYISGCSPVGANGNDYSAYIFPSFDICFDHCADECLDLSGLDFGLCEAIIGIGWNGQECISFSGCSTVASNGVDYGPYFFTSFEACFNHCAVSDNCSTVTNPLEELGWIQNILNEADSLFGPDLLCECNYEFNQYCYNGFPVYVLEPGQNSLCADLLSYYYKESGELICITGGIGGFICEDFDPNVELIFQRNIWHCSPCFCPTVYDPVCGSNGVTYENSCYAECAGVEWTHGACDNSVCDSLNTGTAIIPPWLHEWIRDLNEHQYGCQGIQLISAVFIDGQYGFFVDDWNAADGEDYILDCEGNYYCSAGGGFSQPNCGEYDILYPIWQCEPTECAVFITSDHSPDGAELFAQATGIQPIEYKWSTGDIGQWSFAPETGTYCVRITDAIGCVAEACLFVDLDDVTNPCFSYIQVEIVEQGQGVVLSGKNKADGPYSYQWSNGSTTESIEVFQNGFYCVEIVTVNGCRSTACVEVILANPYQCSVSIKDSPTTAHKQLKAEATGLAPFSYHWNTGDTTRIIFPEESGVYCVEVVDANGCRADDCILFDLDPDDGLVQIYGPLLLADVDLSGHVSAHVVLFQIMETDELIAVDTAFSYRIQGSLPGYIFVDVEPGRYLTKAFITKPENVYVPTYHYSAPFWNNAEIIEAYEPFNFAEIEMIPVRDHEGDGVISGQVFAGDNFHAGTNDILKSAGEGLSNVELILFDEWDEILDYRISDEEGHFTFGNLDFGTYKVYLEIPGIEQVVQIVRITPNNPQVTNIGFEVNADGATTTSIDDLEDFIGFQMYPNPVKDDLSIHMEMKETSVVLLQVSNLEGKIMYQEQLNLPPGKIDKTLDVSSMIPGIYILQLNDQKAVHSERFVKL